MNKETDLKKDLFDFVIVPTKNEFRKKNCIDNIYGIPKLKISSSSFFLDSKGYLINDAIVNYNNEVFVAKVYLAYIKKYHKYYKKKKDEEYSFWTKKYIEQTIKELYSIYDKSIHIINYLYDLRIEPNIDFKKNVRDALKQIDKEFYDKINSVYSRLYGDQYKNIIRDDITHNMSNLFIRYVPKYEENKKTVWKVEEAISIDEGIQIIESICKLLEENKIIIINKLSELFPAKNTKEYQEKQKKLIEAWKKIISSL